MADEHNAKWYRTEFIPKIYLVSGILIAGTAISFAADRMGVAERLGFTNAILFAMGVATVKAAAVIYIFMHLKWDFKLKTISLTLLSTILFFIGMMWLTVGSESVNEKPGGTDTTWKHSAIATDDNTTDSNSTKK
ncbi:MAG TPA: hypothetical protein DGP39_00540 [Verrucomicrobiales bacterium]|nr:hypothetical protein [Verrucomicrobiales bacterium]|tara:strand:- start:193 stop:597 length:405 start_codon:yes stop_codon:yes gene_type:complete